MYTKVYEYTLYGRLVSQCFDKLMKFTRFRIAKTKRVRRFLSICTHFFTLLSPVVLVQKPLWLQRYRFFLIYAREKCRLQKKCRKICVCGEKVVIPKAWRVAGDADPCVSVGGCDQPPIVLHKRFLTHGNRAPVAV